MSSDDNLVDALCYVDKLEWCVRHPLSSYDDQQDFQNYGGGSEEEFGSDPSKREYQQFQAQILKRQIDLMIADEMMNNASTTTIATTHPSTSSILLDYEPKFTHSQTNLSEHYKQMMEKQEFIPFLSEKEKEEYLERIEKSEPLYYYHTCIHTQLAKNYGEETLRKTNEYLQQQIKLLEREKTKILLEIENVNKKRKREQFDLKYELDKLAEKSVRTNHLIFKLTHECKELESLNKKIKQSRENSSTNDASSDLIQQ